MASSATMRSTRRDFSRQTKGIYKQSDVGGSLGGPVPIPGMYNGRNRTFFFVSYEGFYNKQGSNAAFRSVPTPEMWDGDFSNWVERQRPAHHDLRSGDDARRPNGAGFIRDPFPEQPDSGRSASAPRRSSTSRWRGSVLVPNRPGLVPGTFGYVNNNFVSEGRSTIEKTNKFSLKIDHTLSNRHRVAYVFNRTQQRDRSRARTAPTGCRHRSAIFQKTRSTAISIAPAGTGSARAW